MEAIKLYIEDKLYSDGGLYDRLEDANSQEHYEAMQANIDDLEYILGALGLDEDVD